MTSLVQSAQQAATVAQEVALPVGKELLRRLISAMVPMGMDAGIGVIDPTQGLSRANFTVDPMGSKAHEAPFSQFREEFQRPVVNISDLPEQLERKKEKEVEPRRESLGTPSETRSAVPLMKELGAVRTRQPLMKM